jgi:ribosomal protein S18 acetylase RimI-like enzyme
MSKFILPVNKQSIASQIAALLNAQNNLTTVYTPNTILTNNLHYLVELGGFNERHIDNERKILGVCGYMLNNHDIYIRHLSILKSYRRQGIATKLLQSILDLKAPRYYMQVRSTNMSCLHMAERLGFKYTSHIFKQNYAILTLEKLGDFHGNN